MSVLEQHAAFGETVDVRCMHVARVASETADPVVHVIDGNKKNIWPSVRLRCVTGKRQKEYQCQKELTELSLHEWFLSLGLVERRVAGVERSEPPGCCFLGVRRRKLRLCARQPLISYQL